VWKFLKGKIFNVKRILFIGVIFALLFLGCKKSESIQPFTKAQIEDLSYLPSQSEFVEYLNLNELNKTGFWDSYFKYLIIDENNSKWVEEFKKRAGVSFGNGISQAFIASGKNFKNIGIAVFDKNLKKIKAYFEESDTFTKKTIGTKSVYILGEKFPLQFYFVNDSTLLTSGDENYINSVLNGKNESLTKNTRLMNIIEEIKNKNHYWIAGNKSRYTLNYMKRLIGLDENLPVKRIMKTVKSITLSAKFDDGIDIESNWICNNSQNAYLLSTAIKGALAMDILSGNDFALGKILQKTEVERENSQVTLQLELSGDDFNKLKDIAKKKI
jgi:hypothetical protein